MNGERSLDLDVIETALPGVVILKPARHGDSRGFFSECWHKSRMTEAGFDYDFVQDNHSLSVEEGTLRGLHFQSPPHAQAKLVRCGRGRLLDVAVDARKGSPTYGAHVAVELSFENGLQLLIPEGFLHGFITREPNTEVIYKCSDYYAPECDGAVRWDSCGVDWGTHVIPKLSPKDDAAQVFADFDSPFTWEAP